MPSFFDIVASHADDDPDRLALLTEQDGTRTYGQLTHNAAALGVALHGHLGIPQGGRLCLWASNRPQWVESFLAAAAAGIAPVAANPEWTDAETGYVLRHSAADAVVCEAALAERAMRLATEIPGLRHVIVLSESGLQVPEGAWSFADLLAAAPQDSREQLPTVDAPQASLIMYTSGTTTGRPKAVVSQQGSGGMSIDYHEMFGLVAADRALVVTPFFHGNGFGGVSSALLYGASAVFPRRFSASRFWDLVDLYRPTYLFTLAPIVNILFGRTPSRRERTHTLRVLIVLGAAGAAPAIEKRYGAPLIDWYGMTEAGTGTYTRLDEPRKPGSAGRAFPGSAMSIVRHDGLPAEPGEIGEVVFRRDSIGFGGYLNDDEATSKVLDDAWFHTGDLGYFDEEGYFFFVDRKKDIVRRGGENISSLEVEAALRSHPHVADAGVVAAPDSVLGEHIAAFVVPLDPTDPPDADSVTNHVATQLAHFKVPQEVFFVAEMPRTPTGKIEKFRLRDQLPEPSAVSQR